MDYPRSHTNPLANLVVLSALDIRRHLREIVQRDLPIGTLPTFLHEATHHWCFDTLVGMTLHLLFLRARRTAGIHLLENTSEDHAWNVLDAAVRYESALELLRPLSEGMALFAEHDAIPGETRTISTPMTLVAGLYGRAISVKGDTLYGELPMVLAAGRLSRNHLRRKADLLIQPMTCDQGGYLPGYLLVKGLWQHAIRNSDMFLDTDFFLQYLRSYLFDDWTLVSILLDESTRDMGALDHIAQHISKRVQEFVKIAVRDENAKLFETLSEKNEKLQMQVRTKLVEITIGYLPMGNEPDAQLGRARFEQCIRSMFEEWPDNTFVKRLINQDVSDIWLRRIINLGHAQLEARPNSSGVDLFSDGHYLATVSAHQITNGHGLEGPVSVDILSLPGPGQLCAAIMRNKETIKLLPFSNFEIPSFLQDVIVNRQERASIFGMSEDMIKNALSTADLDDHLDIARKVILESLNNFFVPLALNYVSDENLARVMADTAVDGLLPLLEGNVALVLDAAALSLCLPSPYNFNALSEFHQWSTGSPHSSIEKINHLTREALGTPALVFNKGRLLSVV